MVEEKKVPRKAHNIILEDRHAIMVSGVSDVDSFDEQTVVLFTDMGELTVQGANLHINKLNVETGDLTMEGEIQSFSYSDDVSKHSGSFFSRLFK